MKLVKGMLFVSMLAATSVAWTADKAAEATDLSSGVAGVQMPTDTRMSGDDEWACKVAMCMANPGGPTQFAECRPPIERLRRHLKKGRPFPVCRFLGSSGGNQVGGNGSRGSGRRVNDKERDPLQAL